MFLIDHPTAVATQPTPTAAGTPGWFTGGDPTTATPATVVTADFLNMLQGELAAILTAAGVARSKTNNAQVIAALNILFAPLLSPAFAGTPTAPTASPGTNTSQLATTAFVQQSAGWSTGDVKLTLKTTADTGWVMMNDLSIGNAGSGATGRQNADTQALYVLLWSNINNTWAPVAGGRGASALADFNAGKPMTLPRALGRALGIAGSGSGLTARALGSTIGAETHTLSEAEMPSHTHTGISDTHFGHSHTGVTSEAGAHNHLHGSESLGNFAGGGVYVGDRTYPVGPHPSFAAQNTSTAGAHTHNLFIDANGVHSHLLNINNTGGGAAHNNMQPTMFLNAMIRL